MASTLLRIYQPLDHSGDMLRLLHLLPAPFKADIECYLTHSNFTKITAYEALSYEWGPRKSGKLILIGGEKKEVTMNLWAALRQLRHPDRKRVLWIDALCINQEDIQERNHQVSQMGRIYKSADCVITWLGMVPPEEDDGVRELFTWMHEQLNQYGAVREVTLGQHIGSVERSPPLRMGNYELLAAQLFLRYISTKSYWQRTWIVQEVVLASHLAICYGRYEIDVRGLEMIGKLQAGDSVLELQMSPSSFVPMQLLEQRRRLQEVQTTSGQPSLENLLYVTRTSIASDPRDRLFALQSLLTDSSERDAITVDYGKEPKTVYQEVTEGLIRQGRAETALRVSIILDTLMDPVQRPIYRFRHFSDRRFNCLMYEWTEDGATKIGKWSSSLLLMMDTRQRSSYYSHSSSDILLETLTGNENLALVRQEGAVKLDVYQILGFQEIQRPLHSYEKDKIFKFEAWLMQAHEFWARKPLLQQERTRSVFMVRNWWLPKNGTGTF
jgi:hypothetical protein